MSILGVGIDLVDLSRIRAARKKNARFSERILTPEELALGRTKGDFDAFLGGRFAAKEAFVKALGCGIGPLSWQDIRVLSDERGNPFLEINEKVQAMPELTQGSHFHVSISHEKEMATAIVIWEAKE